MWLVWVITGKLNSLKWNEKKNWKSKKKKETPIKKSYDSKKINTRAHTCLMHPIFVCKVDH